MFIVSKNRRDMFIVSQTNVKIFGLTTVCKRSDKAKGTCQNFNRDTMQFATKLSLNDDMD